jgi:pimeloyl-ACP methyl ester carboxylesterase
MVLAGKVVRMKPRRLLLFGALLFFLASAVGIVLGVGSALSAPHNYDLPPPDPLLKAEEVRYPSDSGATLSAWLVTPEEPRAGVVLLHGIHADRRAMLGRAALLSASGFVCLLPDLQGHGESLGERITFGYLESSDALASVDYLRARYPALRIGGIGLSLGGASFLLAGERLEVDALVVESVYATIEEAVGNRISMRVGPFSRLLTPLLLVQLGPRLGFRSEDLRPVERIENLKCPCYIVSGAEDRCTPEAEARRLYEAAPDPKELWMVSGAGHVDLLERDPRGYRENILPFLTEHLVEKKVASDSTE